MSEHHEDDVPNFEQQGQPGGEQLAEPTGGQADALMGPAPMSGAGRTPEPSRHYGPDLVKGAEPTGGFYEGDKAQEAAQAELIREGKQEVVPRLERRKVKLAVAAVAALFLVAVGSKMFSGGDQTGEGAPPQAEQAVSPPTGQVTTPETLKSLDDGYANKQGAQEQLAQEQAGAEASRRVWMARDQAQGEAFGGKPKDMPAPASAQAAQQDPWAQARHQYMQQAASQHYQDILAARRSGLLAQLAQSQTSGERQGGAFPSQERGMYASARAEAEQRRDASLRALQMLDAGGAQRGGPRGEQGEGAAQREAFLSERHAGPGALMAQAGGVEGTWRVSAGTLIELVLETGLNSDVPGMVRGRVAAPVWDRTGKQVVIPTGSVLVGIFNARVQQGDERVQLAWTRLELPTGERIELGGQPGTELTGAAGVGADVDRHLDEVFQGAILSSIFSVGAALTQGTTSAFSRTPEQAVSGAIAGEFNETGKQLTRRAQERAPTLTVPPGAHIGILLKEDMIF